MRCTGFAAVTERTHLHHLHVARIYNYITCMSRDVIGAHGGLDVALRQA